MRRIHRGVPGLLNPKRTVEPYGTVRTYGKNGWTDCISEDPKDPAAIPLAAAPRGSEGGATATPRDAGFSGRDGLGIAGSAQAVFYPLLERPSGRNSDQHSDRCSTMHPGGPPAALPSCMSARKRPRRSGPASPPIEPTADSVPADDAGLQHQFRDVQARKQSKADELRSARAKCAALEARCAVLSGEMEDLTRQENTLRAQVATEHNSTQSKLVQLPNEVRQLLLGMLGVEALGRLAATSKDWQHSIVDPMHWQVKVHTANATCLCRLMVHLRAARVDTGLATICCQRVRKIGDGGKGKITAEGTAFNSVGGCKALVAAMRSHAAVANLQAEGCRAVMVLCRGDEGKAAMLAAGGAEAVVGALRAHVGVAAVQEAGCAAVCNLAGSDEGKAALVAAGGAEAVVGALRAHPGVAVVQMEGCRAARRLAYRSAEGQAALRQAGAEQLARNASRDHPSHSDVQQWSARLLRKMAE
jgi:hypothetical protein